MNPTHSVTNWLKSLFTRNIKPAITIDIEATEIDYSDCDIYELPANITEASNLRHLYLHNTKLRSLPIGIERLSQLKTLTLYGNPDLSLTPEQEAWIKHLDKCGCSVYLNDILEGKPISKDADINIDVDEWMEYNKSKFLHRILKD